MPAASTISGGATSTAERHPSAPEAMVEPLEAGVVEEGDADAVQLAHGAPFGTAVHLGTSAPARPTDTSSNLSSLAHAIDLSDFTKEGDRVEAELADGGLDSRADLLAMYGRSSAASGRFDLAAAAYAMFLTEFGTKHLYSSRIAMRFADCLAPLNLNSIDIIHTAEGPEFSPQWRMGYGPSPERLQQAVAAYESAARLANHPAGVGRALLRMGWVYRALDDWQASTEAWDRCSAEAAGAKSTVDALWLAAENLAWTGHPAAAADRLRRFAAANPHDARSQTASDRAETLEPEARRTGEWLDDPVASLLKEQQERVESHTPTAIYRSVMRWLQNLGVEKALLEVNQWVVAQESWPPLTPIEAHYGALAHLLSMADSDDSARAEAVSRSQQVMALARGIDWDVPAAIDCPPLSNGMRRCALADQILKDISARVHESSKWAPCLLSERVQPLLNGGDQQRAEVLFRTLMETYPRSRYAGRFTESFTAHA
ncbi:MAG TPA: hypothetical protein VM487_07610 [Phycisphaerae bacterium]|nr:hypothetical protein [Phycisphaerae bacterium]